MTGFRDVYIVATDSAEPLAQDVVTEAFEAEDVKVVFGEDGCLFSVRAESSRVDVKFEARLNPLGWTPDLLTGTPELRERLEHALGFYRVSFEPGTPQPSIAAFEALWTVRTILELNDGVAIDITSFKLHSAMDVEEITELDFGTFMTILKLLIFIACLPAIVSLVFSLVTGTRKSIAPPSP